MKTRCDNLLLEARYQYIMQTGLYPILRAAGFRKFGPCYKRKQGVLTCKVFIEEQEDIAAPDRIRILIHLAIYCSKEILAKLPFPFRTPILRAKLSHLFPELPRSFYIEDVDHWEQDDRQTIKSLQLSISEYLLPFFDKVHNLEDVIAIYDQYLVPPWDFPASGIQSEEVKAYIHYMLGNKEKCAEILDSLIRSAKFPSFKARIEELRQLLIDG